MPTWQATRPLFLACCLCSLGALEASSACHSKLVMSPCRKFACAEDECPTDLQPCRFAMWAKAVGIAGAHLLLHRTILPLLRGHVLRSKFTDQHLRKPASQMGCNSGVACDTGAHKQVLPSHGSPDGHQQRTRQFVNSQQAQDSPGRYAASQKNCDCKPEVSRAISVVQRGGHVPRTTERNIPQPELFCCGLDNVVC